MRYYSLNPPPMSPLARVLAGVVGIFAVIAAFFFGLFILAVAIGIGALAWIGIAVRTWWLGRQVPQRDGEKVIDAEYTIISRRDSQDQDRP